MNGIDGISLMTYAVIIICYFCTLLFKHLGDKDHAANQDKLVALENRLNIMDRLILKPKQSRSGKKRLVNRIIVSKLKGEKAP